MKAQLMKHGRQWALYGVLLSAMVYAALTLNSQPTYAATCNCKAALTACQNVCASHHALESFLCGTTKFTCICFDHTIFTFSC